MVPVQAESACRVAEMLRWRLGRRDQSSLRPGIRDLLFQGSQPVHDGDPKGVSVSSPGLLWLALWGSISDTLPPFGRRRCCIIADSLLLQVDLQE